MTDLIGNFLRIEFNHDISNFEEIVGGERSRAYIFNSANQKFIFRINNHLDGFQKDKYAFEHFSKSIPIPEIYKIGQFNDQFYAISEFLPGKSLKNDPKPLSADLISDLFFTLDKLKAVHVPENTKFGSADIDGIAHFNTWADWVLKENTPVTKDDGTFYSWEEVMNIDFVDKNFVSKLFSEIKSLINFVPDKKYLIHGDFGTGNIMIDRNKVTGVIDWNEFGYGDFLFDLAYLNFWLENTDFISVYKKHLESQGIKLPNFDERLRCHQLTVGLNTLGIYAAIGWEEGYKTAIYRINKIL
jgi:hygromycin-B 4-O-kinase